MRRLGRRPPRTALAPRTVIKYNTDDGLGSQRPVPQRVGEHSNGRRNAHGQDPLRLGVLGGAAGHFLQTDLLVKITESKGLPAARALVLGSGVVQVVAATMVVLGLWADLGGVVLFVFLLLTAFLVHNFWQEADPQQKMLEQIHFNKDVSLAGAALFLAAFVATYGDQLGLVLSGSLYQRIAG